MIERPYSNSRIDKCGDFVAVRKPWPKDDSIWDALIDKEIEVLESWRSLHVYPLDRISRILAQRASSLDPAAIFAQRLKRFRSIRQKLKNEPNMALTTMQDIAGCRAVVGTISHAYALKRKFEIHAGRYPNSGPQFISRWTKDYVQEPKDDGYRSIHLVLKYRAQNPKLVRFNGLRVEVQIRSRLQHAWAMAVETASAVTNQALKSGEGEEDWRHFFKLMGDFMAMKEECPLLLNPKGGEKALRREAAKLATRLKVIPMLEGMSRVIERFAGSGKDDLYLLILDSQKRQVFYRGFMQSDFKAATEEYSLQERANKDSQDVNVVLVAVKSIKELKDAYPSYFLDSTNFIALVKQVFQ